MSGMDTAVPMERYKQLILALLVIFLATDTAAQEHSMEQHPAGSVFNVTQGASSKLTFRVRMKETGYELYAGLNGSVFNRDGNKQNLLHVVYNTCTDSDEPELYCLEAQVTVKGKPRIRGATISFYLYGMFNETTYQWGVQRKLVTTAISLTKTGSGNESTPESIRNNECGTSTGVTVGGYALAGVTILVMFMIGVIVAIVVCKKKNNEKKAVHQDGEQQV